VGTYLPIEDYGIIGDLHTVALVGKNGSIDFLSFPAYDSPTVFAALLDDEKGGRFSVCPRLESAGTNKQMYLPDTNILITRFLATEGSGRPPGEDRSGDHRLRGLLPAALRLRTSRSHDRAA
jgi:GH15 family glucan-1,4-alpha-glucosidase